MKRCPKLEAAKEEELEKFIELEKDDGQGIKRAQAILLLDQKTSYEIIKSITGYQERTVLHYRKKYFDCGLDGIKSKRKKATRSLLTKQQREEIIKIVNESRPSEHGYEGQLFWTTAILGDFIKVKFNVLYKTRKPLYLLFQQSVRSFHKPGTVYVRRDEKQVEKWKETTKPVIEEMMKDPNIELFVEDEMVLSTQTTLQKIWLPVGQYPKIEMSCTRENRSFYGFLNIKTGNAHAFIKEVQNMYITVEVLKELRTLYPHKKIVIVWDNARWHKGSEVLKFIAEDGNISLLFFPPYSPEQNPQEHVWKSARSNVTHNKYIKDINETASDFKSFIESRKFLYKLLGFAAKIAE